MIPHTVNICGVPHTVVLCEDHFNTDTHFGQIQYKDCEIRINRDMPEPMQRLTLMHEMVHGILVMIGRNDLTEDEVFVESLALALSTSGFEIKDIPPAEDS